MFQWGSVLQPLCNDIKEYNISATAQGAPETFSHQKTSANTLLKLITTAEEGKSQVLEDFRVPQLFVVFLFFFILHQLKALRLASLLFSSTSN